MSNMRDSGELIIVGLICLLVGMLIGLAAGTTGERNAWINLIVDKPKYIEAVKQQEIKRRDAQAALVEKTE